jgi:hypothetical protein
MIHSIQQMRQASPAFRHVLLKSEKKRIVGVIAFVSFFAILAAHIRAGLGNGRLDPGCGCADDRVRIGPLSRREPTLLERRCYANNRALQPADSAYPGVISVNASSIRSTSSRIIRIAW